MNRRSNMYALSVKQWNPFAGCGWACSYCKSSFQAQAKRQRKRCPECYTYEPHKHKRLNSPLPKTGFMQFIFTCASGDVSFCDTEYLNEIVVRMRRERDKTFLIQSKNPETFTRISFPDNVILGTTLETNRDQLCQAISKAPPPSKRFADLLSIQHSTKMVTIEPVMDFDLDVMLNWMEQLRPAMIWLGYDSKRNNLPEPDLAKVEDLYWELGRHGFTVVLKKIREARQAP